jgi:hypothetical protein
MCAECGGRIHDASGPGRAVRLRLWEFPDQAHCPVIGTCLSHGDLLRIARSLRLSIDAAARDYDVHGFFVRAVTTDGAEARAVAKLLDERHTGALRLVSRRHDAAGLLELWDEMRDGGRIAGGFWAFMTHRHVPTEVRGHIFGEVHMLSHLMGASCRAQSAETAALRQELKDLHRRRDRSEAGLHDAIGERDRTIEILRTEITSLRTLASRPTEAAPAKNAPLPNAVSKLERALAAARGRARAAEAELSRLQARRITVAQMARTVRSDASSRSTNGPEAVERTVLTHRRLAGRSILYVGGRNGQMPHLQKVAETFGAELLHHDGGLEHSIARIDDVLPSVDCVLCPIDCVSHDACLRAKQACKKLGKSFVPLRSASKACLRHALISLTTEAEPGRPS